MKFEWDPLKNDLNFKKHGLWFEEAQTIWADSTSQEFFDFVNDGITGVHSEVYRGMV